MEQNERRQDARVPLERRTKLLCGSSPRAYAGSTRDVSATGCLVIMDNAAASRGMLPGEPIRVGIDWTGNTGLLEAELMPEAEVVRMLGLEGRLHIAVRYTHRQELAATG